MNAVEIEAAVSELASAPYEAAEFPFQFLAAFDKKETTLKRLRKGDSNKSDVPGAVLLINSIHLATCPAGQTRETLERLKASPKTAAARAKFIFATDGSYFEAEDATGAQEPVADFLPNLANHFGFFLPLAGISTVREIKDNPIDVRATVRLNKLYVELLRVDASMHLMRARQQLLAFLLRHGRSYPTGKHWTQRHRSWVAGQTFQQEVHRIVFQDYVETVWTAQERRDALIERIGAMTANWSLGPLVEALRGLRGIDLLSAATFICTTGDLSRFESPRMLMGYLGLVPSEHSSGGSIRRGGITKTGNREARRMLIEAAWSYRYPARVAKEKAEILVRLPKSIRDIAWKAQTRLCARYRTMVARGKKPTVVVAALPRELAGFIWAIGQEIRTPLTT